MPAGSGITSAQNDTFQRIPSKMALQRGDLAGDSQLQGGVGAAAVRDAHFSETSFSRAPCEFLTLVYISLCSMSHVCVFFCVYVAYFVCVCVCVCVNIILVWVYVFCCFLST